MMHNFGDPRLHTHGDRLFIDRRSCWSRWWCIPSATTDYARMEAAALSIGDHIGLPRVLIHIAPHFQWPSVLQGRRWCTTLATTDYVRTEIAASSKLRRQPTTYTQRSPLYRLVIILAFHVSSSTSPLTSNDLLFFKDNDDAQLWRPPTTYARRSPVHRNFDDNRLCAHGERLFYRGNHVGLLKKRRWCIPSTTTDYSRLESVALSTGDHIGLPRVLIHLKHYQPLTQSITDDPSWNHLEPHRACSLVHTTTNRYHLYKHQKHKHYRHNKPNTTVQDYYLLSTCFYTLLQKLVTKLQTGGYLPRAPRTTACSTSQRWPEPATVTLLKHLWEWCYQRITWRHWFGFKIQSDSPYEKSAALCFIHNQDCTRAFWRI